MSYGKDDWLLLLGRILMTTVFCQSLQHHLPDYPAWIGFLTHQGVPYPQIGGVLADATVFVSIVLLLTGWYPKLLVRGAVCQLHQELFPDRRPAVLLGGWDQDAWSCPGRGD